MTGLPGGQGRLLALDLGTKRVGMAVSDELRISVTPVKIIERRSWKTLLERVRETVKAYDVKAIIIGLPLRLDGTEGDAAKATRETARKFEQSLNLPIFLQNESLTSIEAESELPLTSRSMGEQIDSQAAAVILREFIVTHLTNGAREDPPILT